MYKQKFKKSQKSWVSRHIKKNGEQGLGKSSPFR